MQNIEIKIWTMEEGKIKEIIIPEFDNQIFVVKEQKIIEKKVQRKKPVKESNIDRGEAIILKDDCYIYTNVLDECKKQAETGDYDFTDIVKKYHPNVKKGTINRYAYDYRKYLGISIGKGGNVKRTSKRTRRRRRTKPSSDCVYYNKKYHIWITKDDIHKVRLGINTVGLNYIPTSENISKQTNLKIERVRATIDELKKRDIVKAKRHIHKVIYEMT